MNVVLLGNRVFVDVINVRLTFFWDSDRHRGKSLALTEAEFIVILLPAKEHQGLGQRSGTDNPETCRRNQACWHLDLGPSNLQSCVKTIFCCFKPPSLCYCVRAPGTRAHIQRLARQQHQQMCNDLTERFCADDTLLWHIIFSCSHLQYAKTVSNTQMHTHS